MKLTNGAVSDLSPMYRLVLDSMSEGVSVSTEDGIIVYSNPAEDRMFGYDPGELLGQSVTVQNAYPPEENKRRVAEVIAELHASGVWVGEWRNKRKDGSEFFTSSRITAVDLNGKTHWVCVQQDITLRKRDEVEREEIERQLLLLVEASGALLAEPGSAEVLQTILELAQRFVLADAYAVWRRDCDSGIWRASSGVGVSEQFLGASVAAGQTAPLLDRPLAIEDIAGDARLDTRKEMLLREGMRSLLVIPLRIHGVPKATVAFYWKRPHSFSPEEIRIASAVGNLAASALGAAELYDLQQRLREAAEVSERRSSFLADAGAVLSSSLDYHTTLTSVAKLAVPSFADWAAVDMVGEDGTIERVAVEHTDPAKVHLAYELRKRYPPLPDDKSQVVLRTGEPVLMSDIPEELLRQAARDEEHYRLLRELGLRSALLVPIVTHGRSVGIITFVTAESHRRYGQADLRTAEEVARRAAAAIENARLYCDVRESEERFRQLAENIREVFYIADQQAPRMLYVSPGYEKIWGAPVDSLYRDPRSFLNGIHEEDRDRVLHAMHRQLAGESTQMEYRVVRPDGAVRWVWDRAFPIPDDSGRVYRIAGIAEDITGRKQAEQELRAATRTLSAFLQACPLPVMVLDEEGTVRLWNQAAETLYGWSAGEVLGRFLPVILEERRGKFLENTRNVLEGRPLMGFETHHQKMDGSLLNVQIWTSVLTSVGGRRQCLSIVADMTERTRAEAAVRESEERFRAMADSAPVLIWVADANGGCTWFNRPWLAFTGRTLDAEYGYGWSEGVHPEDLASCIESYNQAFDRREPFLMEYRLRRQDGQWRWLLNQGVPRYGPDHTFMGFIGSCIDITGRREAEHALRRGEERLRLAADAGQIGLWDWDILTNSVVWSERVYEFHGLRKDEFEGTVEAFAKLIHPEDWPRASQALAESLESGEPYELEFRTVRPDGSVRWLSTSARVVRDGEGRPVRMLGASIDVTERRQTEDELRKANASLEEFAYVSSHDLQEPLRMVSLYTQLLLRKSLVQGGQAESYAGIIQQAVTRMEELIRDLLSYSRVMYQELPGSAVADLTEALDEALRTLEAGITGSGAVVTAGTLPKVRGEMRHLALVFQNLISNSLKYQVAGGRPEITVSAEARGEEWLISVRDNGIGFEQCYAERIFGLFRRLHRDEYPGTGLGLAICQRIVERYGGRIWAESSPGAGAAFHFTIPAAEASA